MGYRQVYVKNANKLSFKDNQLIIYQEKEKTKIPLEDVNFIILDDYKTIITVKLLAEISKFYICLIVCNEFHDPATLTYSYNQHYKQLEVLDIQINVNKSVNDILWEKIIISKIYNQLLVIKDTSNNIKYINMLSNYLSNVELGDKTNREGLAAKCYFKAIFDSEFIRFYDDSINLALNYGYAILKSAIVRALVSKGLLTYIGIHHKSKTNCFNLAYDLIEPYRPVIDKFVCNNKDTLTNPLSFEVRKNLVNLLNESVKINEKVYTVQFSIDILVDSYIKSMVEEKDYLLLPTVICENSD